MTVALVMTVYNGGRFIRQQLETIRCPSRPPDEVVLCDDGSEDETVAIIRSFIEDNHLQNSWRLYQNRQNKGYPGNFYFAMSLCSGGLIFLADQDDIWHPEKIARMYQVFEEHAEAKVVSCKFGLIDAEGADIHSIMSLTRRGHAGAKGELRRVRVEDVFYKYEWPGMVLAYRQEWYQNQIGNRYIPTNNKVVSFPHDFLICVSSAEDNGFYQMDAVLACHRRHDNNTGGKSTV